VKQREYFGENKLITVQLLADLREKCVRNRSEYTQLLRKGAFEKRRKAGSFCKNGNA
jgi:hypothetical protein